MVWSEEQKEERMNKNEQSLRNLRTTIKCTNTHKMGIPEGKEREGGKSILEEIMTKHFQI